MSARKREDVWIKPNMNKCCWKNMPTFDVNLLKCNFLNI